MSTQVTETPPPTTDLVVNAEIQAVIREAMDEVASGKRTLEEVLQAVATVSLMPKVATAVEPEPVLPITEAMRADLARLPEVYGRVVPTKRRMLRPLEITALAEERTMIDRVIKFLGIRKDTSIRATVLNHLDVKFEQGATLMPEVDEQGHYIVGGKEPVPGMDNRRFSREVRESKPVVDSAELERVHTAGGLDRQEYLAITSVPPVKRVFDPVKAAAAIKKDPALLYKIARVTKPGSRSAALYLR